MVRRRRDASPDATGSAGPHQDDVGKVCLDRVGWVDFGRSFYSARECVCVWGGEFARGESSRR